VKQKLQEEMVAADSKAKFLHDAEKYMLHGKVQQAIGEYQKIIKSDPNDVLILNTIGDLYLRQGDSTEANRCFSQVAENYVRNNFFLKAIAVYKKILNTDPQNLEISLAVASLCAKQGLNIDARNQYQRIAGIYEKEGKVQESLDAYEKIVELDPSNATIQRRLAELQLLQGLKDKAHFHFTGAARALAKAGNFTVAVDCFQHAMQLNPSDVESMKGLLDCSIKTGSTAPALNQLKTSLEAEPESIEFREMLGRAYLADKKVDKAAAAFQTIISVDESRYPALFDIAQAYLDAGEFEKTGTCLDSIAPILITHRETDRAAKMYESILQINPSHLPTLDRLASLYFAVDDQNRYIGTLDRIVELYLKQKNPAAAVPYLEKILQANPESARHRELHRKAFTNANPDVPYVPPVAPQEPFAAQSETPSEEGHAPSMVEIDLLLNYGMRDKALRLLQSLESDDPGNREVRVRLLALYKEEKNNFEAAGQCLLLSAICRRSKDEESAQSYWTEAQQLAPDLATNDLDLYSYARRHGIEMAPERGGGLEGDAEVDLSGDLLDILFSGNQDSREGEEPEAAMQEEGAETESFPQGLPPQSSSKTIQEQLQEVDFYIRLGFRDEALSKLDEIAKSDPDSPELASRFQKLAGGTPPEPVPSAPPVGQPLAKSAEPAEPEGIEIPEFEIDAALDRFTESRVEDASAAETIDFGAEPALTPPKPKSAGSFQLNEMFSDLMEEVSSLTDQELSKETFENHFGLGTAYREMDLLDEAIKEFQIALRALDSDKDARKVVQCCGMLSTCFIKKNMPRSVLRWCQTGLSVPDVSSHEALAFRYDMGVAHLMDGSGNRALECFDQIFTVDPGYRDVAQRIDELKGGLERHAP
jgi:pilus assembly protein FimV